MPCSSPAAMLFGSWASVPMVISSPPNSRYRFTMYSGAVRMTDDARRKFLKSWQERKQETITHPYLGEKMPWGLVPYMQALLLSRFLRGDLDAYPPFLWK